MGQHYVIYSQDMPHIKRQYTICGAIQPELYSELLLVCDNILAENIPIFNNALLDNRDGDAIFVTCKDYRTKTGVTSRLNFMPFEAQADWIVEGPMGLGLQIDTNGHNFIFTAGTGILIFLDLIARLVL